MFSLSDASEAGVPDRGGGGLIDSHDENRAGVLSERKAEGDCLRSTSVSRGT